MPWQTTMTSITGREMIRFEEGGVIHVIPSRFLHTWILCNTFVLVAKKA